MEESMFCITRDDLPYNYSNGGSGNSRWSSANFSKRMLSGCVGPDSDYLDNLRDESLQKPVDEKSVSIGFKDWDFLESSSVSSFGDFFVTEQPTQVVTTLEATEEAVDIPKDLQIICEIQDSETEHDENISVDKFSIAPPLPLHKSDSTLNSIMLSKERLQSTQEDTASASLKSYKDFSSACTPDIQFEIERELASLQKDAEGVAIQDALKNTKPEPHFKVWNVVATVDLGCSLNLRDIALRAKNSEYNPKRNSGCVMRLRHPKATAVVFSTGKMICLGTKSDEDCKKAAKKFARSIKLLGYDVRFTNFKVVNVVSFGHFGFEVRLETLFNKHHEYCSFEPELFPGLIYRIYELNTSMIIFKSGTVNIMGAKSMQESQESYDLMLSILKSYKL